MMIRTLPCYIFWVCAVLRYFKIKDVGIPFGTSLPNQFVTYTSHLAIAGLVAYQSRLANWIDVVWAG